MPVGHISPPQKRPSQKLRREGPKSCQWDWLSCHCGSSATVWSSRCKYFYLSHFLDKCMRCQVFCSPHLPKLHFFTCFSILSMKSTLKNRYPGTPLFLSLATTERDWVLLMPCALLQYRRLVYLQHKHEKIEQEESRERKGTSLCELMEQPCNNICPFIGIIFSQHFNEKD